MNEHNESLHLSEGQRFGIFTFSLVLHVDRAHRRWIYVLFHSNPSFTKRSNHEVRLTARYFLFVLIIHKIPDVPLPCHFLFYLLQNNRPLCVLFATDFVDFATKSPRIQIFFECCLLPNLNNCDNDVAIISTHGLFSLEA